MPMTSRSRRRQSGVAMIWYSLMLTTLMLPLMGIAVDLTILYTVQARLSAAVDGAALGAGRLLGTQTGTSAAATQHMAGEFFLANFPAGYWSTPALTLAAGDMSNSAANTYGVLETNPAPGSFRIAVVANVRVPLIFARVFNVNNAEVATTAVATRRSSRIEYVLDRSGSMGALWSSLATNAIHYAGFASPGVDELGLVLFGSTGVVAYPNYTKPYPGYTTAGRNGAVPNTGGPDPSFIDLVADQARDGKASGCTDMLCMMYQSVSGGATGMAEGLDLAYIELQKAHLRDLAADGQDGRMNTVVFFTDGVPNQVPVYANDPNHLDWMLPDCPGNQAAGCTKCSYTPATVFSGANDNRMLFMAGPGTSAGQGNWTGPYQLAETDTANTTLQWVKETNPSGSGETPVNWTTTKATKGCTYASVVSGGYQYWKEMAKLPSLDFYGTSTYPRLAAQDPTTPGYYNTALSSTDLPKNPWPSTWTTTNVSNYYYWGVAAWTATDNIGYMMRTDANQTGRGDGSSLTDTNHHMPITIYTIGYTGNTGVDDALLKRLANTTDATGYVSDGTQQVGKYYPASDTAGIGAAMGDIMSSVLRLAQ